MQGSLGRGIGTILLIGVALGLAHNGLGLASRPPRGIPWVAAPPRRPAVLFLQAPPTPAPSPATATATPPAATGGHAPAVRPSPTRAVSGTSPTAAPVQVPELDHPAQVDLVMAKRLFDARAALFVDARDRAEYEAGHIPGALRLTRNDALAEPARLEVLGERTRPIVTYCEGGTCEASLDLARLLVESGFRKVLVFPGGLPEWQSAGHPVARGSGTP